MFNTEVVVCSSVNLDYIILRGVLESDIVFLFCLEQLQRSSCIIFIGDS